MSELFIKNDTSIYTIGEARTFADVQQYLRYNVYPNEQSYIESTIMKNCDDIGSISFSGIHNDNVIKLTPKNKDKRIDTVQLNSVLIDIIEDIYRRNMIDKFGIDERYKAILYAINRLFHIIDMDDMVKVYI